MELSELTISDLSTLMTHISRRMSKLSERTLENSALWEELAFKRGCLATEFNIRMAVIKFPEPSIKIPAVNKRFYFSISDNGIQVWDRHVLVCQCENNNDGAAFAHIIVDALNADKSINHNTE